MAETGRGNEVTRAPRLPLEGEERARILKIIRRAVATRPAGKRTHGRPKTNAR